MSTAVLLIAMCEDSLRERTGFSYQKAYHNGIMNGVPQVPDYPPLPAAVESKVEPKVEIPSLPRGQLPQVKCPCNRGGAFKKWRCVIERCSVCCSENGEFCQAHHDQAEAAAGRTRIERGGRRHGGGVGRYKGSGKNKGGDRYDKGRGSW